MDKITINDPEFVYLLSQSWAQFHIRKDGFYFVTPNYPEGYRTNIFVKPNGLEIFGSHYPCGPCLRDPENTTYMCSCGWVYDENEVINEQHEDCDICDYCGGGCCPKCHSHLCCGGCV